MAVQEMTEARMSITPERPQPRPETVPTPSAPAPGARVLLPLALTTGGLLWLCHFPVAWGWLAWVALLPLLALVRSPARARTIFLCAFAGGLFFYLPALQWMRVADPRMYYTWVGLAIYCAFYFPVAILLVRLLERRTSLPLPATLPVVWTALEFLRSHIFTGFSWYLIGHTQHDWLPIIQVADLTGVYGVSLLVVAVNAVVFEALWLRADVRRMVGRGDDTPNRGRSAVVVQVVVVLAAVGGTLAYGFARLREAAFTSGPRIALVQGSVPQQIRIMATMGSGDQGGAESYVRAVYGSLTNIAVMYGPDLIVWPETSYPGDFNLVSPDVARKGLPERWKRALVDSREEADDINARWPTNVLLGLNTNVLQGDGSKRYNSALLIDRAGHVAGRYDKMHRVPFGEYVPLRDVLPFMNRLAPYDFEYGVDAGEEHTRFPLSPARAGERPYTFGVVICYEDTVSDVARPYGGGGSNTTDFLLNISNDGWFDGTSEHEEHLAICRFRAVEGRRCVARAVNMGVSAVIDGNGRVLRPRELPPPHSMTFLAGGSPAGSLTAFPWPAMATNRGYWVARERKHPELWPHLWCVPANPAEQEELPPSQWKEFKKTSGVLLATVPIDTRSSFYARCGDWLPWACWALLAAGIVVARPRRREV
jgi:apolipoprotein N-acyltransferase